MKASIEELFIVEIKLVFPLESGKGSDEVLRQAVKALGGFSGDQFVPEGKRAESFMRGEISASSITLIHPAFTDETDYPNSWLSVGVDIQEVKGRGTIFVGIHMGRPGEQIDLEWKIGVEIAPRLIDELIPTLAFMNGRLVDVESSVFPPDEPMPGSALPAIFTPYTFFDREELDSETRKKLSVLPAFFSGPLANGWVVQAVKTLRDSPNAEFLAALKTLPDRRITYRGPVLIHE